MSPPGLNKAQVPGKPLFCALLASTAAIYKIQIPIFRQHLDNFSLKLEKNLEEIQTELRQTLDIIQTILEEIWNKFRQNLDRILTKIRQKLVNFR